MLFSRMLDDFRACVGVYCMHRMQTVLHNVPPVCVCARARASIHTRTHIPRRLCGLVGRSKSKSSQKGRTRAGGGGGGGGGD